MELKLEIKFASVEELATVAKALTGLKVESAPSKDVANIGTNLTGPAQKVEAATPVEAPAPKTAVATEPKLTAAEKKALKKEQDDAEKADRIARLKAQMEQPDNKKIAEDALNRVRENPTNQNNGVDTSESPEAIAEEIKALGDELMAYTGIPIEAKQQLTKQVMDKVGVPSGVRPSMLQQPMLGQFRDEYRSAVRSVVNPVMGGLV